MPLKDPEARRAYRRAYYLAHREGLIARAVIRRRERMAPIRAKRIAMIEREREVTQRKQAAYSLRHTRLWKKVMKAAACRVAVGALGRQGPMTKLHVPYPAAGYPFHWWTGTIHYSIDGAVLVRVDPLHDGWHRQFHATGENYYRNECSCWLYLEGNRVNWQKHQRERRDRELTTKVLAIRAAKEALRFESKISREKWKAMEMVAAVRAMEA